VEFTKETFDIIFQLSKKQPWLNDKTEELKMLIFSECSEENQRKLIIDLIDRFLYLDRNDFAERLDTMAQEIYSEPHLNSSNTQIVAMAADSKPDSSEPILYHLKAQIERLGWGNTCLVNRYNKAYGRYSKNTNLKNIVLVDEFIGSGQTLCQRVRYIESQFNEHNITDFTIRAKFVVASEVGYKRALEEGINIDAQNIISKGISGYYDDSSTELNLELMDRLENLLSERDNGKELPKLGYGQTESLYCRQDGNTPNSVFPIFWWKYYRDLTERKRLLIRSMGD